MIIRRFFIIVLFCLRAVAQSSDSAATEKPIEPESPLPVLIPPSEYVTCGPVEGGSSNSIVTISTEQSLQLQVTFNRQKLPVNSGVQFLTVTIFLFNKQGILKDKIVKQAFTFPKNEDGESDRSRLHYYAKRIVPFGFVSERKIERVMVLNDTLPEWSVIKVEVTPSEDYTKFAERYRYKLEWWYKVRGSRIEGEFFLGIPKVLYDSRKDDPIAYGNASAMLRLYLLNGETGDRFPVNVGIGTFGVSTPIDVSKNGGGFAVSLMFDVVQALRYMSDIEIPGKVNGGIELTPFFPIERRARILINARIGYAP